MVKKVPYSFGFLALIIRELLMTRGTVHFKILEKNGCGW